MMNNLKNLFYIGMATIVCLTSCTKKHQTLKMKSWQIHENKFEIVSQKGDSLILNLQYSNNKEHSIGTLKAVGKDSLVIDSAGKSIYPVQCNQLIKCDGLIFNHMQPYSDGEGNALIASIEYKPK